MASFKKSPGKVRLTLDWEIVLSSLSRRWLFANPLRPSRVLLRCANIFKFRVSFRVSIKLWVVKLDYVRLDSVRLKLLLTRFTSGVYIHLCVEG